MKRSSGIEISRLASELQSMQSPHAFYIEKAENSMKPMRWKTPLLRLHLNACVGRMMKHLGIRGENWLQCGSHDTARHTAFKYSLLESGGMNELDFGYYIERVLTRIQEGDTDFHGMLPSVIILPETAGNTSAA